MKHVIGLALGVCAALAVPAMVSAQVIHADMARKADLQLTQPMVVGTQTLQPGEYRYQCITIGEETFLVITTDEGKEVARVPCKAEPLARKAEISDIRTITRDGRIYLTAVRIKGELVMHRLVPAPGA
jgi:hypothetical protein